MSLFKALAGGALSIGTTLWFLTLIPSVLSSSSQFFLVPILIEFEKAPENTELFAEILDKKIRSINSDYDAKRQHNLALKRLIIHTAPKDTFYNWMKTRGKLGAQHKVPRLANSREYIDSVLELINKG